MKSLINGLVPPFLLSSLIYFRRLFLNWRMGAVSMRQVAPKSRERKPRVRVLGNGPCLKKDLDGGFFSLSKDCDHFCVNGFVLYEEYELVQPSVYFLLDPFFLTRNVPKELSEKPLSILRMLNDKTCWSMTLVVPPSADMAFLMGIINNKNIEIKKINAVCLRSYKYNYLTRLLLKTGFFGPEITNVVIYALLIAVLMGYKKIEMYGVDMSLHEDLVLNQKNNELYYKSRHHKEDDVLVPFKKVPLMRESWSMGEILEVCAKNFFAHDLIEKFSKDIGAMVINRSSFSFIDAYNRNEG
jgi:hypothetical protein